MDKNLLFDKYLRKIDYTFRRSGLYLRNRENYNVTKARLLYCFNFILVNLDVAGSMVWIAKGEAFEDGLVSVTHTAPSAILALLCDFKSLSFMWYHDYVDKLVFKLRELETKMTLNSIAYETCVEEPIKFLEFALKVSGLSNWLLILAYPLMPLSISIYNYLVLKKVELVLPFLISYPFDAYDIKIYPFVLLNNFYAETMAIFWIFSSESFYYTCATFIIVQFRLLQQELRLITPKRSGNKNGRQNEDKDYETKIMELINWHQELIEAVNIIETIYSKSTLFNFMSSSAMICLVGFNVT
ncbi:odorant receptor 13a-like, partial [Hyposmocoma kahamanoa]|uniref:odorant receptor 13a-like n=1 Tax=Hyposmocoma kahamanoa TaxID=1477025 RepID=UPI000E6D75EA